MTTETPDFLELIEKSTESSFKLYDLWEYSDRLSMVEILVIASKPYKKNAKITKDELRAVGKIIKKKLWEIEAHKDYILEKLTDELYRGVNFNKTKVNNYLERYRLLTEECIGEKLEARLNKQLVLEIRRYRELIRNVDRKNEYSNEAQNLKNTSVNLTYWVNPNYSEEEPLMIAERLKHPTRIASKIPYKIIEEARKFYGNKRGNKFEDALYENHNIIKEGLIADIEGIQVIVTSKGEFVKEDSIIMPKEIAIIKRFIEEHKEIIEPKESENHYLNQKGPYGAIHMDVAWNPEGMANYDAALLLPPEKRTIELKLLRDSDCIEGNFGLANYWRRINAQEKGIVQKNLKSGRIHVVPFSQEEKQFKEMMYNRVLQFFSV